MKNKILYIILLIIFIIFIICSVFIMNKVNINNKETSRTVSKSKTEENVVEENTVIEINSSNFDNEVLNEEKVVLVDFYAVWCNPCKKLSPIIEEIAKENNDIKFVKVDVDRNKDLSTKYNVQAMPTLIVFKKGEIVNRSIGLISKEDILKLLEK